MPESRAERNRKLRSEKRQRMIRSMLSPRVAPKSEETPSGPFSGPEFDPFRSQKEFGVILKFKVFVDSTTKTKETHAFWVHDFNLEYEDAKKFGTVKNIKFPGSFEFYRLLSELEEREGYVHIYVSNQNLAADPENFNKLKNYLENNLSDSETVGWEFGDPIPPRSEINVEPKKEIPAVSVSKEKFNQYQQEILDQIRKTRSIFNKYMAIDSGGRIQALKIGIDSRAAGNDIFSAMEDVEEFLNSLTPASSGEINQIKESSNQRIRKLLDILNELEVKDPAVVKPPARQTEEIPLNQPGGFNVIILNDPVTPAEVVVDAVSTAVGISREQAWSRMDSAHRTGWAVVATYAQSDVAETVAERIMQHARANTKYDHYRPYIPPRGYFDAWPLTAEVMEAN